MEQFVRDTRINQIYEGANGIQALDLVARKLGMNGGKPMKAFIAEVDGWVKRHSASQALALYAKPLQAALGDLQQAALWIAKHAEEDPNVLGSASYDFLNLFGLTALGYMWGRMCEAAVDKLASGQANAHLSGKLAVGKFYVERMLPETALLLARIKTGAGTMMALPDEAF
jgi:hypothetical protein